MIYIRSMRLTEDEAAHLKEMGFIVGLDSENKNYAKSLYSVFVEK